MPLARVPTPLPVRVMDHRSKYYQDAKSFIDKVLAFWVSSNHIYKFLIFSYITLMMLFVFVVDEDTYNFREMSYDAYGTILLLEIALAVSLIFAVLALVRNRSFLMGPLLFYQITIVLFGASHYVYPYADRQQRLAMVSYERLSSEGWLVSFSIFAEMLFCVLIRLSPVAIQFIFTAYTIKVIKCIMVMEKFDTIEMCFPKVYRIRRTRPHLKLRTRSHSPSSPVPCNSHIWSSIRRKIQTRQIQENPIVRPIRMPKQELLCEMSAKFRNSTFPNSNRRDIDMV